MVKHTPFRVVSSLFHPCPAFLRLRSSDVYIAGRSAEGLRRSAAGFWDRRP